MRLLPKATAADIYLRRYWTAPGFDRIAVLDQALTVELFDAGVNMGPAKAGQFLQRALNVLNREGRDFPDLAVDGQTGAMTRASLESYYRKRGSGEGHAVLLWLVRALRTARYIEISEANGSQEAFTYGWIARQVREAA
jgi:lysozyme family protein